MQVKYVVYAILYIHEWLCVQQNNSTHISVEKKGKFPHDGCIQERWEIVQTEQLQQVIPVTACSLCCLQDRLRQCHKNM